MNDSFVFCKSWYDIAKKHYKDDSEVSKILGMIIEYGITGVKNYTDSMADLFLDQVYAQIDISVNKHKQKVESGSRGGKAGTGESKKRYGNKNASKTQAERKQNASKTQANDNYNFNDNENENYNCNVNDNYCPSDGSMPLEEAAATEDDEPHWDDEEWVRERYGELV